MRRLRRLQCGSLRWPASAARTSVQQVDCLAADIPAQVQLAVAELRLQLLLGAGGLADRVLRRAVDDQACAARRVVAE